MCTASHDNQKTSLVAIINGASNYYGIHARVLHLDSLEIIEGTRENGEMYIKNNTQSTYLTSFAPIGNHSRKLNLEII